MGADCPDGTRGCDPQRSATDAGENFPSGLRGGDLLRVIDQRSAAASPTGLHFDFGIRVEFARQHNPRERVKQAVLNRALERARDELRVVAFAHEQFLRSGVRFERETLLQPPKLKVNDARVFTFAT